MLDNKIFLGYDNYIILLRVKKIKILRKTDIILIAAFLIFAAAFYFIFNLNFNNSRLNENTVIIKLNGKIYAEVSLNEEKDIEIKLENGAHSNTVRIKDNKAFMLYANCPDGYCLRHKPLESKNNINEIIVCLPNRVTVEIKSDNKSKDFDAVISIKAPF